MQQMFCGGKRETTMGNGNWVVWGAESGQITERDGNMCQVRVDSFGGVIVWVRIEELRPA